LPPVSLRFTGVILFNPYRVSINNPKHFEHFNFGHLNCFGFRISPVTRFQFQFQIHVKLVFDLALDFFDQDFDVGAFTAFFGNDEIPCFSLTTAPAIFHF